METENDDKIDILDQSTADWAETNRLFKMDNVHIGKWEALMSFDPEYKPEPAAYKMKKYLYEIKQVFRGKL